MDKLFGFWELQRKQEASLLVCHQQIRKLESELIEQRTLLEEDEAHLDKYLKSMKSATSHSRKQHKQKVRCSPPHRRDGNLSFSVLQHSILPSSLRSEPSSCVAGLHLQLHPLLRKAELQTVDSSVAPATVPSAAGVEVGCVQVVFLL